MKIRAVAAILFIALLFTACNVPNAEPSQSQTGSSGVSDSDPASKEESSQPSSEPSKSWKKPLALARELPTTGGKIELDPDEWDIPQNPRYPNELKEKEEWPLFFSPHWERVWWVNSKVLRITEAAGYQSLEGDPIQWEPEDLSPEEWAQRLEEHPELQLEGVLEENLLCDEDGALLYPDSFYSITLQKDYISITDLDRTFLLDYDGNPVDALSFPVTEAHAMDRLPDGTYRGYLGEIVTTYDETGKVLERDTTAYQVPLPGGMVLDAKGRSRSLTECDIIPYLRGHPDPAVEQRINRELEDFFTLSEEEYDGSASSLTFSADCTGDVLHVKYDLWWKPVRAATGDWYPAHIHLDLRTGERYSYYDLFADEEGARKLIFKKAKEEYSDCGFTENIEDFRVIPGYFYICEGCPYYETRWEFSCSKNGNPAAIPLEELDEFLDRDSRFYKALTRS